MDLKYNDHAYMAEAIRQAKRGEYSVRINPRVGCVIVKDNEIIGRGFHTRHGQSHAEINALNSIEDNNAENATTYITLEPCVHYGSTPPCVDALIQAKVSRVVVAMKDPNPIVNGKGLEILKEHGIKIQLNVLEKEACGLNKGFIKRITHNLPYITIKSAVSLDGISALKNGESQWITGKQARYDAHKLRAQSCAILTGVGTVIADNPQLTARLPLGDDQLLIQPLRVILDTNLSIPLDAKVLEGPSKTIIFTCNKNINQHNLLRAENVDIVIVDKYDNYVDIEMVMQHLVRLKINEVLVESGPTLIGRLIEQSMVDEIVLYLAPHLLGSGNYGLANLTHVKTLNDRINLEILEIKKVGQDLKIKTKPKYN